ARRLGIEKALGTTREGKLALWQVIARVIDQGSRLSAVRLAMAHAACDVLALDPFDEDALYENQDWLAGAQASIEDRLYAQRTKTKPIHLFLYAVTRSYFEGTHNALAAFGYNRDGKKGKMQIVIGLLCDEDGYPVSIEVFPGNTQDPVWSKNSCGFTLVVFEEAPKPFATPNRAFMCRVLAGRRKEQHV